MNTVCLWVVLLLGSGLAPAQSPAPAFEVASVKQNKSGGGAPGNGRGGSIQFSEGQVVMENVSLWKCIGTAYGIGNDKDYAITGPDWLKAERFDIVAKIPADTPKDPARFREQILLMFQKLLAERFKLEVHRETKTISAYAIVIAKDGLKVKEAEAGPSRTRAGRGQLTGEKIAMPKLADLLSQILDRPVVDKTETKGVFDIKLEWNADDTSADPERPGDGASGPSIFTALQEQLGLRLQAQKLPFAVLVVDRAEKVPTEN